MRAKSGYSATELDDAQARWDLRFPPDLVGLLGERRSLGDKGHPYWSFDWRKGDPAAIRALLDWPLEGFWFDVQNGLWWPEWGEKPSGREEQYERLRGLFEAAPRLIPVFGHRYLPQEPFERGNPV